MSDKQTNNHIKNAHSNITEPKESISLNQINFSTESETISRFIIEKIISLSISEYLKNNVNRLIPNFCFNQIYQSLDIINRLNFISYDKDDFPFKTKWFLKKVNSTKNLDNKINIDLPNSLKELYNTEIIRGYKFDKEYNPNEPDIIDINISIFDNSEKEENEEEKNNKNVLGILIREGYKDSDKNSFQKAEMKKEKNLKKYNKKHSYNFKDDKSNIIKEISIEGEKENEPFNISPDEKIEEIKIAESHKLNFNMEQTLFANKKKTIQLPFEKTFESTNFWNSILQPNSVPIDRDAGSKIKFEKPKTQRFSKKEIPKIDPDEKLKISEHKNINEIIKREKTTKKIKKLNFIYNTMDNIQNRNRKKKIVEIPFESTDIEPKKLETYKELDEIATLRDTVEKNLQEKKKEKELLAKLEKEKKSKLEAIEEMRRELYRKNVTVDVKGEIVYIKPLDKKNLIEEFNKGKANFKNIKILETEPKYKLNNHEIKVEKNPDINLNDDLKEEKNKKNRKKKIGFYLLQKSVNSNVLDNGKSTNEIKKKLIGDKNAKLVSGSNFAIINPEIGVNITEDKRMKSGGKDFYKKFNRFSIEVFQEQLSKTASSFFPKITEQTVINNQTNETSKTNRIFSNEKMERIDEYQNKKKVNENKTLSRNNNGKNSLSLKTKNLRLALQDLDLIKEGNIKDFNKNKKIKKDKFLSKIFNNIKTSRNNLNDMNKFAKTLIGNENWGIGTHTEREIYNTFKVPKKPENIELKRELPINMLKHMPRKRLPPINSSIKLNTLTGFYTDRKNKKATEVNKEYLSNKENIGTE